MTTESTLCAISLSPCCCLKTSQRSLWLPYTSASYSHIVAVYFAARVLIEVYVVVVANENDENTLHFTFAWVINSFILSICALTLKPSLYVDVTFQFEKFYFFSHKLHKVSEFLHLWSFFSSAFSCARLQIDFACTDGTICVRPQQEEATRHSSNVIKSQNRKWSAATAQLFFTQQHALEMSKLAATKCSLLTGCFLCWVYIICESWCYCYTAQQECRKTVQVNAQHSYSSTKMQICATVESQDFELKVTYDARENRCHNFYNSNRNFLNDDWEFQIAHRSHFTASSDRLE